MRAATLISWATIIGLISLFPAAPAPVALRMISFALIIWSGAMVVSGSKPYINIGDLYLIASIAFLMICLIFQMDPSYYEVLTSGLFILSSIVAFLMKYSEEDRIKYAFLLGSVILVEMLLEIFFHQSLFGNKNTIGIVSGFLILFFYFSGILRSRYYLLGYVFLGLSGVSLYLSGSRSPLVTLLVSMILSTAILWIKRRFKLSRISVAVMCVSMTAFLHYTVVYYYIYFAQSKMGVDLNYLSREYFGKNFFSGRESKWMQAIEQYNMSPIVGVGNQVKLAAYESGLSFHNVYLQFLAQFGLLGVIFLLAFVFLVFLRIQQSHNRYYGMICLMLYALLVQSFEVLFFQNNISLGFILMLGVASLTEREGEEI